MLKIKRKRRYITIPLLSVVILSFGLVATGQLVNLFKASALTTDLNWEKGTDSKIELSELFNSASEMAKVDLDGNEMSTLCYSTPGGNVSISEDCLADITAGQHSLTVTVSSRASSSVIRSLDFDLHVTTKKHTWQRAVDGDLVVAQAYAGANSFVNAKLDGAALSISCYSTIDGDITINSSCLEDLTVGEHYLQITHTILQTDSTITDRYELFVQDAANATAVNSSAITTFRVYFDSNSGENVAQGMPTTMIGTATEADYAFTVPNSSPTRDDGYNFLGWSLLPNMETPSLVANDVITLSANTNGSQVSTVTLYAVWEEDVNARKIIEAAKKQKAKKDTKPGNTTKDEPGTEENTKEDENETKHPLPRTVTSNENIPYTFTVNTQAALDGADLEIVGSGNPDRFIALYIDETIVETDYYTVGDGNGTIITVKSEFVNTLESGEHALTVIWEDGRADGTLTIGYGSYEISNTTANLTTTPVPNTGGPETTNTTNVKSAIDDVTPIVFCGCIVALFGLVIMRHKTPQVAFRKHKS